MIVITHLHNNIKNVFDYNTNEVISVNTTKPTQALFQLAKEYPNRWIAWCLDDLKEHINHEGFTHIFHHRRIMASFEIRDTHYISDRIGYVESSPFVNINKNVTYPTWLMSACIGAVHAQIVLKFNPKIYTGYPFAYVLNSIAKKGMASGLFCYSSPALLTPNTVVLAPNKSSIKVLYQFIKQHYRSRWTLITFFNSLIYEKKLQVIPLIASWFVKKKAITLDFGSIKVNSTRTVPSINSIDVVIPTMGRKPYLLDVLKDLSKQTFLPKQVIIVEQNPDVGSVSDLDYLNAQAWPFFIEHVFTHQTGACNARNMALKKVVSDAVFLADDDIRLAPDILEKTIHRMQVFGLKAATLSCLREGEQEPRNQLMQWHTFGSGCSIITSDVAATVDYDMAFEHGFGEDGDFGMQLRHLGVDIGYLPNIKLLHLKAPMGGFRTKFKQLWEQDDIKPKPSPTIMLFHLKHQNKFQTSGYKTILFFKFYKLQPHKNVISYISLMKKRWKKSVFWANQLEAKIHK